MLYMKYQLTILRMNIMVVKHQVQIVEYLVHINMVQVLQSMEHQQDLITYLMDGASRAIYLVQNILR